MAPVTVENERTTTPNAGVAKIDMKFELIVIPVADVDRAKEFYKNLGWRQDAEFGNKGDEFRIMQFTPPGSPSSVIFGKNVTPAEPGSAKGLYLIVSDIEAARKELLARGVKVSEVFHGSGDVSGTGEPYLFGRKRISGPEPKRASYKSFLAFSDPDGNGWLMQEVTTRLPGRVAGDTTYGSASDLAQALRRASEAHGRHEERNGGKRDENWPDWYAEYMVREQKGETLPE